MRQLETIQKREKLNHVLRVKDGGIHDYVIVRADTQEVLLTVLFQDGPRKDDHSRPGVLDCDLLEMVRDRIKTFQEGPMGCWENLMALQNIEAALLWMNKRVEDRIERNVLGTMHK
jgi:hypothetical protein